MRTWLVVWGCGVLGKHTHQSNLTCSSGEDFLEDSCPGRKRQTKPKQTGLRMWGKQTRQRTNMRKKGFCFLVFAFWMVQNLFWLPVETSSDLQLDLFWGKDADICTGWSHSIEVEVGRTLVSFYLAVCVDGGRGNHVPVYLPSAKCSILQCSSTQGCLCHRMQYICNILVHTCHRFRFF